MPLKGGKSDKAHSDNVAEMMRKYNDTGKIGNITPKNKKHALAIANAAAYRQARKK